MVAALVSGDMLPLRLTCRLAPALSLATALATAILAAPLQARADDASPEPVPAVTYPARAPRIAPERWGLHSGDTIGDGGTLIFGEVGWPDLSFGFQHGVSTSVDIGLRVSFLYATEYVVPKPGNQTSFIPGLGLSIPVRVTIARNDRLSLLVHVDPGIKFDGFDPKIFAGPQLPIGVDLGLHLSRRSTLTLGADVPLAILVTPQVTGYVPLLVGLTFESRFTDHFGMSFNLRTGMLRAFNKTGSDSDLALLAQVGFFGRI